MVISKGGEILGLVGPGLYEDRRSEDFFVFYLAKFQGGCGMFALLVMLKTTRLFFMLGCCETRSIHKYGMFSFHALRLQVVFRCCSTSLVSLHHMILYSNEQACYRFRSVMHQRIIHIFTMDNMLYLT